MPPSPTSRIRAETARNIGLLLVLAFLLGFGLFALAGNSLGALADNFLQRRVIVIAVLTLSTTVLIIVLFHIRLRRQQKSPRSSQERPAYGGLAGVARALLLLTIALFAFDFFLPDFLIKALVDDPLTGQALQMFGTMYLASSKRAQCIQIVLWCPLFRPIESVVTEV